MVVTETPPPDRSLAVGPVLSDF
uniref:Uncharacterized protein n=1 Tax=Rhizophora mucronata TaxID=61149 RepID=A0A2P2NLQ9_RHIMU